MKKPDEKDLLIVKGLMEGDRKSYDLLVERYSPLIYTECLDYCKDMDEANDHLNEILIRIVMAAGRYDSGRAGLYAWIMCIARNYFINHYKKQLEEPELIFCEDDALDLYESKCTVEVENFEDKTSVEEEEEPEYSPSVARLKQALKGVSPRDRSILLLRAEGFSYESIGEFLRIKAGTAMTACSRAVDKIRARFHDLEAA